MLLKNGEIKGRNHFVWVGLAVTLFGLGSYFTIFSRFPNLRDFPWLNLLLVTLGLLLSGVALAKRRSKGSILGLVLSAGLAVLLVWYVFFYSFSLPGMEAAVAVGAQAPPLVLADHEGETIDLNDYAGRKVLVVFYRGFW